MLLHLPTHPVKESTVVLFGNPSDPEVQKSIKKIAITRRKTEIVARPSFDTGVGLCGKHLCGCKTICTAKFSELEQKFG